MALLAFPLLGPRKCMNFHLDPCTRGPVFVWTQSRRQGGGVPAQAYVECIVQLFMIAVLPTHAANIPNQPPSTPTPAKHPDPFPAPATR